MSTPRIGWAIPSEEALQLIRARMRAARKIKTPPKVGWSLTGAPRISARRLIAQARYAKKRGFLTDRELALILALRNGAAWTARKLAREVGVHEKTIFGWPEVARALRIQRPEAGRKIRGGKDAKTGKLFDKAPGGRVIRKTDHDE